MVTCSISSQCVRYFHTINIITKTHRIILVQWPINFVAFSVCMAKYACSSHLSEEKEWLYVSLVNNIYSVGRGIGAVVDCQKNRKLGKLLRMTGHVLCFIKNICLK